MEAAINNEIAEARSEPETAPASSTIKPPVKTNLADGIEVVKQAFDFISELIELNSRIVERLPDPKGEGAMKKKLLDEMHGKKDNKRIHGYNIAEAAKLLGVDRSTLRDHLVVIPNGPVPPLPEGKIPCRKIGKARRIFEQDLFGTPEEKAVINDTVKEATSGSNIKRDWRRQIDDLRFEGH